MSQRPALRLSHCDRAPAFPWRPRAAPPPLTVTAFATRHDFCSWVQIVSVAFGVQQASTKMPKQTLLALLGQLRASGASGRSACRRTGFPMAAAPLLAMTLSMVAPKSSTRDAVPVFGPFDTIATRIHLPTQEAQKLIPHTWHLTTPSQVQGFARRCNSLAETGAETRGDCHLFHECSDAASSSSFGIPIHVLREDSEGSMGH